MSSRPRPGVGGGAVAFTLAALVAVLLAGCSPSTHASVEKQSAPPKATSTAGQGGTGGAEPRRVQKLVTFIVENHSFNEMRAEMPWVAELADRYGYATNYAALTHPSLPNYLAIAGGESFGVTDDEPPSVHRLPGSSVFGQTLDVGGTARLYAEGMNGNCELVPDGAYAVKHNPWAYFVDERDECASQDVPLDQLSGDVRTGNLPAVGMVVPNLCNDAHDCSLTQADSWLRDQVGTMMTGPDWRAGRLAIVITADEDDRSDGNHILTVVAHPGIDHKVVTAPMTHYALGRAYAEVGGFQPLGNSRTATSLLTYFGLTA
jgi:phosphatidylinositol-3-phosphatase